MKKTASKGRTIVLAEVSCTTEHHNEVDDI